MRIYDNCYDLMSEMARDLWEMGIEVKPKSYQNKNIEGNDDFITKELICKQYCLTSLDKEEFLFVYDKQNEEWAKHELLERINLKNWPINPGEAYKKRKDVWEQFLVKGSQYVPERFDYSYNDRIWYRDHPSFTPTLIKVINELKRNPDTRQALLPIFHVNDIQNIGGVKRVPCTVYYNFMVRPDANGNKQLNIVYHQRSSDMATHFGNDVYLAYKLMEFVAMEIGVKPGYLYHTIDSLHSYKKDWDKLKTNF